MKRLIVHIDRLVLKGFRHEDRYALAEGLQQELSRLLAEPGVARHLVSRGDSAQLEAGGVRVPPGARPSGIGAQAARDIAEEIKS